MFLFTILLLLTLLLSESAFAQFDIKFKTISAYDRAAAADTVAMKAAVTNPQKVKMVVAEFTKRTDRTFRDLEAKKLLDPKLTAYHNQWVLLRSDLTKIPIDIPTIERVDLFRINLALASKSRTCTVVVSASRGLGALVKYAKALDADMGQEFKEMGPTVVTRELERAEYKFKSFREGRETGNTNAIPCTIVQMPVSVVIVEN